MICQDAFSNEISRLESEPRNKLPLPRRACDIGRLDKAEARSDRGARLAGACTAGIARRETSRRRQRSSGTRRGKYRAVKDVYELRPDGQVHLLADPERAPRGEVFHGMPLGPVVAVVRRRGAPGAGRRIRPRGSVQHQSLGRIEAVAVEVLEKQRLSRDTIHVR
jgi:hypothetical protein